MLLLIDKIPKPILEEVFALAAKGDNFTLRNISLVSKYWKDSSEKLRDQAFFASLVQKFEAAQSEFLQLQKITNIRERLERQQQSQFFSLPKDILDQLHGIAEAGKLWAKIKLFIVYCFDMCQQYFPELIERDKSFYKYLVGQINDNSSYSKGFIYLHQAIKANDTEAIKVYTQIKKLIEDKDISEITRKISDELSRDSSLGSADFLDWLEEFIDINFAKKSQLSCDSGQYKKPRLF